MTEIWTSHQDITQRTGERAVVMTMGALHPGHVALMHAARDAVGEDGEVIVTVFVNPLQFGKGEDFEEYPRQREHDIEICQQAGVDAVYIPELDDLFPHGSPTITVSSGVLGRELEGEQRPGHFDGMLTIVLKLLHVTQASHALFGEKDYQQLVAIKRMARDFNIPIRIMGVATVRDPDGLAMSSRNAYLSAEQRTAALRIPHALQAAQQAAAAGASAAEIEDLVTGLLAPIVDGYVAVRAPDFGSPPLCGEARLVVSTRVGAARLLDNCALELGAHRE